MGTVSVEYAGVGAGARFPMSSTVASTDSTSSPSYALNGTASTDHTAGGPVVAHAATTTVNFPAGAAFASAAYLLLVTDTTSGSLATITAQKGGSFTFNSVAGRTYRVFAQGA